MGWLGFKKRKNGVSSEIVAADLPDKVEEVTVDEEYYFVWETPTKSTQSVLIQHVEKVSGVFIYTAAFDAWGNRATATYVPWSQRNNIIL